MRGIERDSEGFREGLRGIQRDSEGFREIQRDLEGLTGIVGY